MLLTKCHRMQKHFEIRGMLLRRINNFLSNSFSPHRCAEIFIQGCVLSSTTEISNEISVIPSLCRSVANDMKLFNDPPRGYMGFVDSKNRLFLLINFYNISRILS